MATATKARVKKTEYINTTQGILGAVRIDRNGLEKSLPVGPSERVFLSDDEIEATEQAHLHAESSPFHAREIVYRDPDTGDEISRATLQPLEPAANFRRSGGKVAPPPRP